MKFANIALPETGKVLIEHCMFEMAQNQELEDIYLAPTNVAMRNCIMNDFLAECIVMQQLLILNRIEF